LAEWLVEDGIGECRALLIEGGKVLAAKLYWPGERRAGDVLRAKLIRISGTGSGRNRRGVVQFSDGGEALVDHLPAAITEGMSGTVRIVRASIAEKGRLKHAQARWIDDATSDIETATDPVFGHARRVRAFEPGMWEDIWHAASSGVLDFTGGSIVCSTTPAMTVIDVDGDAAPRDLALSAVPAIARALRLFDLGGSIGIDFPTPQAKQDRRAVDDAIESELADWPHERTAMNGFGFVQIVSRMDGPSLLHRFASSRTAMCARMALRMAERVEGPGITGVRVHPAIRAKLKPQWIDELRRRTGREVHVDTDPGLALETPHAQIVACAP